MESGHIPTAPIRAETTPAHVARVSAPTSRNILLDRARTMIYRVLALPSSSSRDDTVETWQCCFRSDRLALAKSVLFPVRPHGLTFFTRDTVAAARGRGRMSSYPLKLRLRFVLLVVISMWYKGSVCLCPMWYIFSSERITPRSLQIFVSLP